jgi:hypothetical protein
MMRRRDTSTILAALYVPSPGHGTTTCGGDTHGGSRAKQSTRGMVHLDATRSGSAPFLAAGAPLVVRHRATERRPGPCSGRRA